MLSLPRTLNRAAIFAAAALATAAPHAPVALGDCPSNHTFLVEWSYDIDGQPVPVLALTVGYTYTFNLQNPSLHPFMLTASPSGGPGTSALPMSAGVSCVCSGCGSCTRRSIVFTPAASLAGTTVYYQCTVHQYMGNAIYILPAPAITLNSQPLPLNRCTGDDAEFVVSATSNEGGAEVLSYQWTRGGTPIVDVPGRVSGAQTARLVFTGAMVEDQGAIACTVTGPCKTVTTTPVQFSVAACCPADIGVAGGEPGTDGQLDNNDFIVYIDRFFNGDVRADIGAAGGVAGTDGELDNNDFIVFIDRFFEGC